MILIILQYDLEFHHNFQHRHEYRALNRKKYDIFNYLKKKKNTVISYHQKPTNIQWLIQSYVNIYVTFTADLSKKTFAKKSEILTTKQF